MIKAMILRARPSVVASLSARSLALGLAWALFIVLCALPALYMLGASLHGADGGLSFKNYRLLFIGTRQRELLFNSALLGAGASAIATFIGAPLGLLLARADLTAKRSLRLALVIPLVVPSYILALAWTYIGGPTGIVAQAFGRDLMSVWTYSLAGAMIVMGINFYPLSMLATEAAAGRSGSLEEAGLLAARPGRVLRRITLPLIAPGIVAAALIIFVLAVSEFGVPGLLRARVFTTEVFTAFAALYDFGAATALAVPLLALALIAGIAVKLILGDRLLATRRGFRSGLPLALSRWRVAAFAGLAIVLASFVVLPLAALAVEAGRLERITSAALKSAGAITNSLALATISAILIVALAVLLGYGRARARSKSCGFIDLIFITIFAVPSTVLGVGLIGLWNRPGVMGEVYGSRLIIVAAYLARLVPAAALILAAAVRQVPVSLEEAAEVAGAGWPRTFIRIVLPRIRAGLAAALVVSFIFAFGELGATMLVAPPGQSTLPVRVYTLIANAPPGEVAALGLMQACIILVPLALLGVFARGRKGEN